MKPLRIELDERTLSALNRIAPPQKRKRSAFVRRAIREAVREAEDEAMREAYRRQPDSDVDEWSIFEQ